MSITQHITYFKDYSIKTYTEKYDGVEVLFERYNKGGDLVYIKYANGNWYRWKYNSQHVATHSKNYKGEWFHRMFDDITGRLTYEETHEGIKYDIISKSTPIHPRNFR